MASECFRAVAVHVVDGLLQPFHAFHRQLGPQILGLPVGLAGEHDIGHVTGHGSPAASAMASTRASPWTSTPASFMSARMDGSTASATAASTKSVSAALHTPKRRHFAFLMMARAISGRRRRARTRAVARARLDDRYFGMLTQWRIRPAPPRGMSVHQAVQPHEHIGGRPIGGGHPRRWSPPAAPLPRQPRPARRR